MRILSARHPLLDAIPIERFAENQGVAQIDVYLCNLKNCSFRRADLESTWMFGKTWASRQHSGVKPRCRFCT